MRGVEFTALMLHQCAAVVALNLQIDQTAEPTGSKALSESQGSAKSKTHCWCEWWRWLSGFYLDPSTYKQIIGYTQQAHTSIISFIQTCISSYVKKMVECGTDKTERDGLGSQRRFTYRDISLVLFPAAQHCFITTSAGKQWPHPGQIHTFLSAHHLHLPKDTKPFTQPCVL